MYPQQNTATQNEKKLKPGLFASYDIQPRNRMGLFLKKPISKANRRK